MCHDLFEPLTGRHVIESIGGFRVTVQVQKGDASGEARRLFPSTNGWFMAMPIMYSAAWVMTSASS